MKVAVIKFPGSNCDQDALHALRDMGISAEYVWHDSRSLKGFDGAFLPGGFSYGDYLRCGAVAARSPIMEEVARLAEQGAPVLGVCNGFQVLCESGLLPGALVQNLGQKFICEDVWLKTEPTDSPWTRHVDRTLRIPIAHGEGRYIADEHTIAELEAERRIAFRYAEPTGEVTERSNPNGSMSSIAGVLNRRGNVLGMMPHPERATRELLGGIDGLQVLRALIDWR